MPLPITPVQTRSNNLKPVPEIVNPRPIPQVDVRLDETINVKPNDLFDHKDGMFNLWNSKGTVTYSESDYKKAVDDFYSELAHPTLNFATQTPREPPKYYISDTFVGTTAGEGGSKVTTKDERFPGLTCLEDSMILSPQPFIQDTMLDSSYSYNIDGTSVKYYGSGRVSYNDEGEAITDSDTSVKVSRLNDPKTPAGTAASVFGTIWKKSTTDTVVYKEDPIQDANRTTGTAASEYLGTNGISIVKCSRNPSTDTSYTQLKSLSRLRMQGALGVNQPFLFNFTMMSLDNANIKEINTQVVDKWKSVPTEGEGGDSTTTTPDSLSIEQIFSKTNVVDNAIFIQWGMNADVKKKEDDFVLGFYKKDSKVKLFRRGDNGSHYVVDEKTLPKSNVTQGLTPGERNIMIYPVGNLLIVSDGIVTDFERYKKSRVVFNLGKSIRYPSGPAEVMFWVGQTTFRFQPIVHNYYGYLVSPVFNVNFIPVFEYLNVRYEGKMQADYDDGAVDESNSKKRVITFPSALDIKLNGKDYEDGRYAYMSPTTIETELVSTTSYDVSTVEGYFGEEVTGTESKDDDQTTGEGDPTFQAGAGAGQVSNPDPGSSPPPVPSEEYLRKYRIALTSYKDAQFPEAGSANYSINYRTYKSKCIYSPMIRLVEMVIQDTPNTVQLSPNPQISNNDVLQIQNNMTVEGLSCVVTLQNRAPFNTSVTKGLYTYVPGTNNFTGIKPITVKYGIQKKDAFMSGTQMKAGAGGIDATTDSARTQDNMITRFKGFVTKRQYQRTGTNNSVCILRCEDWSLRAKDTYAVNLPIFDGWCNLAAFYVLCKEAGYTDDQILLYQNPNDESDKLRIKDVIEETGGDCSSWKGGCFAGHVEGFPDNSHERELPNVSGEILHSCLPLAAFKDQPRFMFQMGTKLWDCMNEIRDYMGFYLYANHFGSLLYQPPCAAGFNGDSGGVRSQANVSYTFFETAMDNNGIQVEPGNFNEVLRNLDVTDDTSEIRNAVMTQGLIDIAPEEDNAIYAPFIAVKKQKGWPTNTNDPAYVPWWRWLIVRNPLYNDPKRIMWSNEQKFKRALRKKVTVQWGAWGQPWLFPYMLIQVREFLGNETGVEYLYKGYKTTETDTTTGVNALIIVSMSDILNASDGYNYTTTLETELFQSSNWEFFPHKL